REEGFILKADRALGAAVAGAVVVFATDGAGRAGVLVSPVLQEQGLPADRLGACELPLLEVPGRQHPDTVEEGEVGGGAQFAVLGGAGAEAAGGEVARSPRQTRRIGHGRQATAAHRDRFETLAAHDCAAAGPARKAAVVADRGVAHAALTRLADGRDTESAA